MAGGSALPVINHRMRVGVLCYRHHVKPVKPRFRAFMVHHHVSRVPQSAAPRLMCVASNSRLPQVGISRGDGRKALVLSLGAL